MRHCTSFLFGASILPNSGCRLCVNRYAGAGSLQAEASQFGGRFSILCWSRDFTGKPVPTFPDRALRGRWDAVACLVYRDDAGNDRREPRQQGVGAVLSGFGLSARGTFHACGATQQSAGAITKDKDEPRFGNLPRSGKRVRRRAEYAVGPERRLATCCRHSRKQQRAGGVSL